MADAVQVTVAPAVAVAGLAVRLAAMGDGAGAGGVMDAYIVCTSDALRSLP